MAKKNKQEEQQSNSNNKPQEEQTVELSLNLTEKYKSYINKMDQADQKQIDKALEKFKQDPRSLKMKSLKLVDSSTISIEINGKTVPLRIIAYLEKRGSERELTLFWAGTHPEYDKVVARGYVIKSKLESVPSKLYEGLTLSDLSNETNVYKAYLKKEEVLNRMKSIGDKTSNNHNSNYEQKNNKHGKNRY